jgi:hypothetical protein
MSCGKSSERGRVVGFLTVPVDPEARIRQSKGQSCQRCSDEVFEAIDEPGQLVDNGFDR